MATRDEAATHRAIQNIPGELDAIEKRLALMEIALDGLVVAVESLTLALNEAAKLMK